MPRMSYLTFTDSLLLVSFLTMSATIPESLFANSLMRAGRRTEAVRLDRVCRWAFPLTYTLLIAGTVSWFSLV